MYRSQNMILYQILRYTINRTVTLWKEKFWDIDYHYIVLFT